MLEHTWNSEAELEAQEAKSVLGSIGKVKPLFDETWVAPRTKGMIQMSCLCEKRGTMATIMMPNPRFPDQDLVLWSLEGPRRREIICRRGIRDKKADGAVTALLSFEALDAILVVQRPAIMHVLDSKNLDSLVETPVVLHERQLVCMTQSVAKGEIIVSYIDGKVSIFSLTKHTIIKKADGDEASCVTREYYDYIVKERITWNLGGGLNFVRDFTVDEGWHNEGVCVLGIVDMNVIAWRWETGVHVFKISGSHLALRQRLTVIEMRDDLPQIVAGFADGRMQNWSIRPGSRGKVVETLDGHDCAIQGLRIDYKAGVIYSIDEEALMRCWHLEAGTLMNHSNLTDERDKEEATQHNPWKYHEINRETCSIDIAYIDGVAVLLCRTPRHHSKILHVHTHRRFFSRASYPYSWVGSVVSPGLMEKLRIEQYRMEPPPREGLKLPERGAGEDEIILGLCADGSLYMYEATTGEVLSLVVLARRHELFVSGNELEKEKEKQKEKGNQESGGRAPQAGNRKSEDVSGGGVVAVSTERKGKKASTGAKKETGKTGKKVLSHAEKRRRKVGKIVDDFRMKSNLLSKEQALALHAQNEEARRLVEAQLGKIGKRKPDRVLMSRSRSLVKVSVAQLVRDVGKPFGCPDGLLVLLWESGIVDLLRLDTQECVQSYIEVVREYGGCNCFAFFADPGDDKGDGGHMLVTGHGTGHIKLWTKTTVFPSELITTIRVGEDHEGDVVSIVPAGGTVRPGFPQGAPTLGIVGCQRGPIGVYQSGTWKLMARVTVRANLRSHESLTSMAMYTPSILMLCYQDGVMRVWRLTPEKKESEARMMWKAVKNKVVGAVGVQQAIKAIKESAGKLAEGAVVEDAVEDSLDLKSLEAHMDSEDEGDGAVKKPTGMKKLMRSLSVKMLHSARTHIGGLSPLWPVGRKEEGDVDAMFAMQYGRAKIVAVMPEFRKFVVQSDLMNFVEWGIREDEHGKVTLKIVDWLSRDSEIVVRKAGRGDLVQATHAAYLHPGSALIAFAIGDEINMISGGFKHFGSRYAHYSIDMAAKARAGAVSQSSKTTNDAISPTRSGSDDASEHEKSGDGPNIGRTSSQESVLSRTLSSDSDSASSVKSGKPARRKFVRSSERGGGKARKAESARRQKSRRAVVMMDRFETDLPTPRPDYFPDPEPILSEAEKALKDLHKVLGPRMDQIGTVAGLGVPPTPFTLKFSSKEGLQALPDLPASLTAGNSYSGLPAPSSGGRVYIRRSAKVPEPELSPRTLMRHRLKETVRVNRKLAAETGPHLARHMWQGIDMEEEMRAKEDRHDDHEARMSRDMSLGATWGGVACKETADKTIAVADHSKSVNTLFSMTPKNLLKPPNRPQSPWERRRSSSSMSASRSSLSVLSSDASSTVPLRGPHPDPRLGFQVGDGNSSTPALGSWNRHVVTSDLQVSGSQESIKLHPSVLEGLSHTSSPPRRRTQVSTRLRWGTQKRVPLADRVHTRDEKEAETTEIQPDMLKPLQIVHVKSYEMYGEEAAPTTRAGAKSARSHTSFGRGVSNEAKKPGSLDSSAAGMSRPSSAMSQVDSAFGISNSLREVYFYPPSEIDPRERALLEALASFEQQHIRTLSRLLARTRGRTPSPRKPAPMWQTRSAAESAALLAQGKVGRDYLLSINLGCEMVGGKVYSAEAP